MRVGTSLWSLEPEPGWSAADGPECLTLTKSDLGAVQISAARKDQAPATLEELRRAAERQIDVMGNPFPVVFGGFRGYSVSYTSEGSSWRRYWLARGHLWIFATYNGSTDVRSFEEPEVEKMLASLRAENGAA